MQKLPNQEILEVQKGTFWKAAWLIQVPTASRRETSGSGVLPARSKHKQTGRQNQQNSPAPQL